MKAFGIKEKKMCKTQLYLIRHGESEGNRRRAFLGHTDLDLTQKGHEQAENTAQYLKDIHADAIYSSDLLRAYNTAMHTARLKGMEIITNKNLREIYAGSWENKTFDELCAEFEEEYGLWKNNIGMARCSGGESVEELKARAVKEIFSIAEENIGKTVFIFTHATPIRAFKAVCDNRKPEEMKDIPWASNASVTRAEYEDGKMRIIEYGTDYFQGESRTRLPKNV